MRQLKPRELSIIAFAIVLTFFFTIFFTASYIVSPSPRTQALDRDIQIYEEEYDFVVVFELMNVGEVSFDVDTIYFNDKASIEYNPRDQPAYFFTNNTILAGKQETVVFSFPKGDVWISDMDIEVTIQMKSTLEYSINITLP